MHYELMHMKTKELTGFFTTLEGAKFEAERLCNLNGRKEHFSIIKMEEVWVTSTLEEAMSN